MPVINDPAINNPAAYGTKPIIPPTSTNTSSSTSTWTPNLPNYADMAGKASSNVMNQLSGTLNPQDLANAQTWAAQRGVATGTGFESPNNMAAYQQFLGLSSQQLEQQGQTNYGSLLAGAPRTTTASGSQTIDNNVLAATTRAAPDPYAAAMANLAAQQQGLAGGRGAVGGGAAANPGSAAMQAAQQAAAAAAARSAGGGTAGGPATGPFYPGTGEPSAPPYQAPVDASGHYILPTGNTYGGGTAGSTNIGGIPTSGTTLQSGGGMPGTPGATLGGITDSQGNEWVDIGNGEYMNLSTMAIQQGTPGSSSVFGGINTGGGTTYDQFNPLAGTSASPSPYGQITDYSQVGADPMAAALGQGGGQQTDQAASNFYDTWFNDPTGNQSVSSGSMYISPPSEQDNSASNNYYDWFGD